MKLLFPLITFFLLIGHNFAIPIKDFYPYGSSTEDTVVERTLDGSSPAITLPSQFNIFGSYYTDIFVSLYVKDD